LETLKQKLSRSKINASSFPNVGDGKFVDIVTIARLIYNSFVLSQIDSYLELGSVCHATPTYSNPYLDFPVVIYQMASAYLIVKKDRESTSEQSGISFIIITTLATSGCFVMKYLSRYYVNSR